MAEPKYSVCFIPEDINSIRIFEEATLSSVCDNRYFVIGNWVFGIIDRRGVIRYNIRTGAIDFIQLPSFIVFLLRNHGFVIDKFSLHIFEAIPLWNRCYPDRLAFRIKTIIEAQKLNFYCFLNCFLFLDFAKRDFLVTLAGFYDTKHYIGYSDESLLDCNEEQFYNLFEPHFRDKLVIYSFPRKWSNLMLLDSAFQDYFSGDQLICYNSYAYYRYPRSHKLKNITIRHHDKFVVDFATGVFSFTNLPMPDMYHYLTQESYVDDRGCLLLYFDYLDWHYAFYVNGELIPVKKSKFFKNNFSFCWLSYELNKVFFRDEGRAFPNCFYSISVDDIRNHPEDFLYRLEPEELVEPIGEKLHEPSGLIYCLSSKYWFKFDYPTNAEFVGSIPELESFAADCFAGKEVGGFWEPSYFWLEERSA
ncbi:MAG: hypothetical protein KatS3mg087_0154 [Patescibacteria group bacterium]|nr:MAG: hypothetical protein KatS3mg087_0154 [Patescibacteria group bacterium]